jgi:Na+-transporting NADH:ubiquinone oxidoreductase subunit F
MGDWLYSQCLLLEEYLKDHPNPEDCEYSACGPPDDERFAIDMSHSMGVEDEKYRT